MRDFLNIGSTPTDEPCAQIGSPDYYERARIECRAYANQLKRLFPFGSFVVKSFPHDFGTYFEVVAKYDTDEQEREAAFAAEANSPEHWDADALLEIAGARGPKSADDESKFQSWYREVDRAISAMVGLGRDDLPDMPYRDWFDDGMSTGKAARRALDQDNY
jgi:hypothetical protein